MGRVLTVDGWLFVAGTLLSGRLHALSLIGVRGLGATTPFGGLHSAMKPETRDLLEGIAVALLALGVVGLIGVVRSWRRAARATQWPVVPGVVRHSSLKKGRSLAIESGSGGPNRGAVVYRAQVTYAYRVNGAHFEGSRVRFGMPTRMQSKATMQQVVARYPVGTPVQVHHSPQQPADSVLEPGLDPMWRKALVFSVVMLGLALVLGGVLLWA